MSRKPSRVRWAKALLAMTIPALAVQAGESQFAADRPDAKGRVQPVRMAAEPELLPVPQRADSAPPVAKGPATLGLSDLLRLTVERNPRLAQVAFAVDVARGQALQAGLYPNPTVSITDDELLDRTGREGIITAPYITQEIVTADKLKLSKAAALREVDQATLAVLAERYDRFTAVRQSYFDLLTLQRRLDILAHLVGLAEQSVGTTKKLLEAKQVARLDLLQLEVELEKLRADQEATRKEIGPATRRLAAAVGVPDLPLFGVAGSLESAAPAYDLDRARQFVLEQHPEVRSARIGVDRARLLLQRAQAEPVPNVTIGAGYVYQGQNNSNDVSLGVSFPVPVWNKNQGNIAAAHARISEAVAQTGRVQANLADRLAAAFGPYSAARQRAEQYRTEILPRARETFELSLKAYQGGQFEYLRVLEAQRALAQANLEYNRLLGETWRAASDIAGLLLEEDWPAPQPRPH